jgi:hypothetical protein
MTSTKKGSPRTRGLPKALAERAEALHELAVERLVARGRDAIARVKQCQADIATNFVDIGVALAELKADGVAAALGRKDFADVCQRDLGLRVGSAHRMIALATRIPRELAVQLGPDRARALLELADATPASEGPEALLRAPLKLPSGGSLDVEKATNGDLREAAREFRNARAPSGKKRSRGFTTTAEEREAFRVFERRLREHGEGVSARLRLVATRDGKGPRVLLETRLPYLEQLLVALRRRRPTR